MKWWIKGGTNQNIWIIPWNNKTTDESSIVHPVMDSVPYERIRIEMREERNWQLRMRWVSTLRTSVTSTIWLCPCGHLWRCAVLSAIDQWIEQMTADHGKARRYATKEKMDLLLTTKSCFASLSSYICRNTSRRTIVSLFGYSLQFCHSFSASFIVFHSMLWSHHHRHQ